MGHSTVISAAPLPCSRSMSKDIVQSNLELREPAFDGRATWWGKQPLGGDKFYKPTGTKRDVPWIQDCCWKGALTREFKIAKNKKQDLDAGADIEAIMRSRSFLRHEGASRDSQRTGLNTRRPRQIDSREFAEECSPFPRSARSSARGSHRSQTKNVLHGLVADSQDLRGEFKELHALFTATQQRLNQLERTV